MMVHSEESTGIVVKSVGTRQRSARNANGTCTCLKQTIMMGSTGNLGSNKMCNICGANRHKETEIYKKNPEKALE